MEIKTTTMLNKRDERKKQDKKQIYNEEFKDKTIEEIVKSD